jgi:hypothetical protein
MQNKLMGSFVHVDCRTKESCIEHAYVYGYWKCTNTESELMFTAKVKRGIWDLCVNLRVGGDVLGKQFVTADVLL